MRRTARRGADEDADASADDAHAKPWRCGGLVMQVSATAKRLPISARKARLVADQVRGQPVERAMNLLGFSTLKAAFLVRKVVESAIANAENNEGADVDELWIAEIQVNEGTTLKRIRPRAKGGGRTAYSSAPATSPCSLRTSNAMGQKVHPVGMRLGIVKEHNSVWYADKGQYAKYLLKDIEVREHIRKRLAQASVSGVEIQRSAQTARITIHTARPGIVIGKKGEDVERLRQELIRLMALSSVQVIIEEIRKPEIDALLVAQNVAQQLERRVQFRRAMRRVIQNAMRLGAQGIKVRVAGRLGGAEIARSEVYHEGRVPLHTLRANIDYATWNAQTTYGVLGIKVWIFKGEIFAGQGAEAASG